MTINICISKETIAYCRREFSWYSLRCLNYPLIFVLTCCGIIANKKTNIRFDRLISLQIILFIVKINYSIIP